MFHSPNPIFHSQFPYHAHGSTLKCKRHAHAHRSYSTAQKKRKKIHPIRPIYPLGTPTGFAQLNLLALLPSPACAPSPAPALAPATLTLRSAACAATAPGLASAAPRVDEMTLERRCDLSPTTVESAGGEAEADADADACDARRASPVESRTTVNAAEGRRT
jgi:hypothetical protein